MTLALVGTDGTVDETAGARRWGKAAPAVCVRRTDIPTVRPSTGRIVTVSSGTLLICGVLTEITTATPVELAAVSSGTRTDVICLRLTWLGTRKSRAEVVALARDKIIRTPGVTYDAPIATVTVSSKAVTTTDITPVTAYAAGGMHLVLPTGQPDYVDAHDGADLTVESTGATYRRTGGTWKLVEQGSQDWQTFDPVLTSGEGPVKLGNGGLSRGRYKLVGNRCLGEFEIRQGATGGDYGINELSITLPYVSSTYTVDQWFEGHVYTWREAPMDWIAQWGVRTGTARATLFTPTRSDDCRMRAARSADSSRREGTGIPQLNNDYSDPGVVSGFFDYVIEEPTE